MSRTPKVILGSVLLASASVAFAETSVTVTVTNGEHPWVVAVPLTSDAPARTYAAHAPVKLGITASTLLCAGGEQRATVCEQITGDQAAERHIALDEGRVVKGR